MVSIGDPWPKRRKSSVIHYCITPHSRVGDLDCSPNNTDTELSRLYFTKSNQRRMSTLQKTMVDGFSDDRRKSTDVRPVTDSEDLGFRWTPSMQLRGPTSGSATSEHPWHRFTRDSCSDRNGAVGNYSPRPPTRLPKHNDHRSRDSAKLVYFNDGRRRIDYVLVYDQGVKETLNGGSAVHRRRRTIAEKVQLRQFFQENLRRDGLHLEEDILSHASAENREVTVFVKIHGTWPALCRQAEFLKMKMPLRLRDTYSDQQSVCNRSSRLGALYGHVSKLIGVAYERLVSGRLLSEDNIGISASDGRGWQGSHKFVTWPFQRNKIDKYAISDQDGFFSPTQRMEMVWEIMQNARNDPHDEKKRGIEQLLEMGIYDSAFPIHDGPATVRKTRPHTEWCERQRLRQTWASWGCALMPQPLALIRRYYGEKVGFYFAFLGYYTKMLTVPALVGICTFFYGIGYAGDDDLVKAVCNDKHEPGNWTMCPICRPPNCDFTKLSDACTNTAWDYRMDNEATLIMAAVTVVWATVFLKSWKRRESELAFEWDTYEVRQADGIIRPDYEERAPTTRRNPTTKEVEPYVPWITRFFWLFWSSCITLFMLFAVGVALALLVLARIALYGCFRRLGIHHSVELARWCVHGLTFIVVVMFDTIYSIVGRKTTSLECPRTEAQWLSSFLWKLFIFQLLNDFVPIATDHLIISAVYDYCFSMSEVTESIAVLLLARLVVGNSIEIGVPFLRHLFAKFISKRKILTETSTSDGDAESGRNAFQKCQWRSDKLLSELVLDGVADEYMEMVVQFAFVTLFVPAFPIAPFVCLLNNILEIRVDAIKLIVSHRRPLPTRVPGIQIWNEFLDIVAMLAVLCNGALVSFTSGMIPRLYYKHALNNGYNYDGFIEHGLTYVPAEAWYHRNLTYAYYEFLQSNVSRCYYQHYRSPDEKTNFELTQTWWKIFCVRLGFFCAFICISFAFQWLYNFLVPDIPAEVTLKMQRRRYVVSNAMETDLYSEKWLKHAVHSAQRNGAPENVSNGRSAAHTRKDHGDKIDKTIYAIHPEGFCEVQSLQIENGCGRRRVSVSPKLLQGVAPVNTRD